MADAARSNKTTDRDRGEATTSEGKGRPKAQAPGQTQGQARGQARGQAGGKGKGASQGQAPGQVRPPAPRDREPGHADAPPPVERRRRNRWVPLTAGWLSFLLGLSDVIAALSPAWHWSIGRFSVVAPGALTNAAKTAMIISGLLLLLLSHALRRRKHRAWEAVTVVLAISVVVHIVRGTALVETLISIIMLAALIFYRHEFYAVGDPRTRWRALYSGIALAVGSVVIGLLFVSINGSHLTGDYSFAERLQYVLYGMVGIDGPVEFTTDRLNDLGALLLGTLGLFTALVTAYLFFRPAEPAPGLSGDDEAGIRELLGEHGSRDSLGYFSLRRDKSVIWSPTGKACITYRVVSGVMIAAGDPIGDPEAWPGAIQAFVAEADRHAWVPAVMGCGEQGAEVWCREGGLDALEIGDEAIVEVPSFSLQGRAMRNVRQMVNRVGRQGYESRIIRERDLPPGELAELWEQAAAWRGTGTERGFSMALGRVGDPADGDCVIVTAMKDGRLRAFLRFVPWGPDGLSLDIMRREKDAQSGLNDFMIAEAVNGAAELGIQRMSLNFAVFRAVLARGERVGAGPVVRAFRRILIFLSRWFQIESLYKFNAKFQPTWQPRFLVFPGLNDLPRIALAAMEAEAFIVWPRLRIPGLGGVRTAPDALAQHG